MTIIKHFQTRSQKAVKHEGNILADDQLDLPQFGNYSFSKQGQFVAVYYDNDFYLG